MKSEERIRYYQELSLNLQREGLTVKAETEDGLLPVELDDQLLCCAMRTGGVMYQKKDVPNDTRSKALERVKDIARTTSEYMRQMESAPLLSAIGLTGDYRLLAEFNGAVLAGHQTRYGVQFVTWERSSCHTSLTCGHYYGPNGADSYTAAKQDFAVRSGLIPRSALFTPEQLTEVYRSIHETLEIGCSLTDEHRKCLELTAEQIESGVLDLIERAELSTQMEMAAMESPQDGGMQFS